MTQEGTDDQEVLTAIASHLSKATSAVDSHNGAFLKYLKDEQLIVPCMTSLVGWGALAFLLRYNIPSNHNQRDLFQKILGYTAYISEKREENLPQEVVYDLSELTWRILFKAYCLNHGCSLEADAANKSNIETLVAKIKANSELGDLSDCVSVIINTTYRELTLTTPASILREESKREPRKELKPASEPVVQIDKKNDRPSAISEPVVQIDRKNDRDEDLKSAVSPDLPLLDRIKSHFENPLPDKNLKIGKTFREFLSGEYSDGFTFSNLNKIIEVLERYIEEDLKTLEVHIEMERTIRIRRDVQNLGKKIKISRNNRKIVEENVKTLGEIKEEDAQEVEEELDERQNKKPCRAQAQENLQDYVKFIKDATKKGIPEELVPDFIELTGRILFKAHCFQVGCSPGVNQANSFEGKKLAEGIALKMKWMARKKLAGGVSLAILGVLVAAVAICSIAVSCGATVPFFLTLASMNLPAMVFGVFYLLFEIKNQFSWEDVGMKGLMCGMGGATIGGAFAATAENQATATLAMGGANITVHTPTAVGLVAAGNGLAAVGGLGMICRGSRMVWAALFSPVKECEAINQTAEAIFDTPVIVNKAAMLQKNT